MHYFKRDWGESRGDEYDSWGCSEWWLELDDEGYTTRCLQKYQNGNVLFYSESHMEDKYGALPEGSLDISEFQEFTISKSLFETALDELKPINVPDI